MKQRIPSSRIHSSIAGWGADAAMRGYLREKVIGETETMPELPEIHIRERLVKAAGHRFLRLEATEMNLGPLGGGMLSRNRALLQTQADILYFSGHCTPSPWCSAASLAALDASDLEHHWDKSVKVYINAACHVARIFKKDAAGTVLEPADNIHDIYGGYANFTSRSPGQEFAAIMPEAKVILGYRFKGPRDIADNSHLTRDIIHAFMAATNNGEADAATLCAQWMEANRTVAVANGDTWDVGVAGNEGAGKFQRPWNACAIDVQAGKFHFYHHETWDGELPAPNLRSFTY